MFSQSPLFSTQGSRNYEVFLSDRSRNYSWTRVSFQYCSLESFQMVLSPKKKKVSFSDPRECHPQSRADRHVAGFSGDPSRDSCFSLCSSSFWDPAVSVASLSFLGLSCLSPAQGDHQAPPGFPCPAAGRLTRWGACSGWTPLIPCPSLEDGPSSADQCLGNRCFIDFALYT